MPPMVTRFVASALLALPLSMLACLSARSEPAPAGGAPSAVAEPVAAEATPEAPVKVVVGAYINDIQELDFKTNSYAIDLYVWFRWKASDLDPSKTMEFMNRYASDANIRDELYDKPQAMPDGSLYSIIRYQGQFSTKFQLEKYPFDTQSLLVVMEDTVAGADAQVYVPDPEDAVTINPDITLPGFKIGKPEMRIVERPYPTNFGDISAPEATDYSRVILTIPVTRPIVAVVQDLRAHRLDRGVCGARFLRAAPLRRGPHRPRHHRASDAGRSAADLRRVASRRRLSDDGRQDLSPCLPVHHLGACAGGDDLMARCRCGSRGVHLALRPHLGRRAARGLCRGQPRGRLVGAAHCLAWAPCAPFQVFCGRMPKTAIIPLPLTSMSPRASASKFAATCSQTSLVTAT